VHNQYLQVALDTGIIGLLAFLVLVGLFYYQVLRVWRAAQETELAKIGFLLVTILLLHAGFDVDLTFPMLFGMLICLMGMFFGETEARSVRVRINNKKQRGGRLFSKLAVHALFVCCVFGSLWSTIGNSYKLHGVGLVQHAKWEEALADFSKAESMIPWSDTAHYEAAKLYVILGNQTKDFRFYQHARTELEAAQRLVPKQSLYPSLLQQLPK
jgi:tetratricopeptide (TPR) repeat protein